MNKTLRASPSNSHPLFEKSGAKTLTLKSKIVRTHDFRFYVKVLMKLFQKFLGFGVKPQGFDLHALVVGDWGRSPHCKKAAVPSFFTA